MSGIAAIIDFTGSLPDRTFIHAMTATLASRGPDGTAHWFGNNAHLGFCKLASTAEALGEDQPCQDETGNLLLLLDGRIDDRDALKATLQGAGFAPRVDTDAELVLQGWLRWGNDLPGHINGEFALLVLDQARQAVFCARDRAGSRPLYYFSNGHSLVVASTAAAVLKAPPVNTQFNTVWLADFLSGYLTSHSDTFWQGIHRLPPASCMTVSTSGLQIRKYWQPDTSLNIRYVSDAEYAAHYLELLQQVVREQSRSHAPLACDVSGGLDSSALFAIGMQLQQAGRLQAPGIRGYGLAFPGDPQADELVFTRAVGKFWHQPIREIPPSQLPVEWYRLRAAETGEFPGYPNGTISMGLRQAARADGCRAVLSGTGGDEWLGGMRGYYAELIASRQWQQLAGMFRIDARECGRGKALRWLILNGMLPLLPWKIRSLLRALVTPSTLSGVDSLQWLSDELRQLALARRKAATMQAPQQVSRVGQRIQLNNLDDHDYQFCHELMEQMAAEAGLELRRPFWDHRLVQFSISIPEHIRLRGSSNRYCHRLAMQGLLPASVLDRHDKATFMTPYHKALNTLGKVDFRHLAERHPAWVNQAGIQGLQCLQGIPQHRGIPEWLLWQLIGCDNIAR